MATVLVIDDERLIRWSIEQTLCAAGHVVSVAASAAEGLALFRRCPPEVVLLDLRLPDEDGLTVLGRIVSEGAGQTAVIVMTAFSETYSAADILNLGARDYLKKPFDFDALETIVGRALERGRLEREVPALRAGPKDTGS